MKNFFKSFHKETPQTVPANQRQFLTRTFVETGDERCPLGGIWSRLPEMDATIDDEPGLTRPAWERFLLVRFPVGRFISAS
jgi:hypothetical protein